MIGSGVYSTNFYTAMPPANSQAAAADAKAAADFERILNAPAPSPKVNSVPANSASPAGEEHSFLSFIKGVIDVINPLHHIPVIGAIYRHMTGDEIGPVAHLAGGALYGGAIGGAVALADVAFEKVTGHDVGETVIAALTGDDAPVATPDGTMIAANLSAISPAAGDDIIWSTPYGAHPSDGIIWSSNNPPLSRTPTLLHRIGTNGAEPAYPSAPAQPVLSKKDVDSTTILRSQEAPAQASRTDAPPGFVVASAPVEPVAREMIAYKMMEALDKYRAMNTASDGPHISEMY